MTNNTLSNSFALCWEERKPRARAVTLTGVAVTNPITRFGCIFKTGIIGRLINPVELEAALASAWESSGRD
jgi:hypothetical protein